MDKQDIQQRIEKLRAEIDRRRYEYHVLDKPATDEMICGVYLICRRNGVV